MLEKWIWLVPTFVLAAGIWRGRWAVYLFAATIPLFGSPPGGPYLAAADTAALALVLVAVLRGQRPPAGLKPVFAVIGAWIAISVASLIPYRFSLVGFDIQRVLHQLAYFPYAHGLETLVGWRTFANLLLGVGVGWSVLRLVSVKRVPNLLVALGTGGTATVLLGLASRLGALNLWTYRSVGGELWDDRLHSVFFHSGWLAEYLILIIPVALVGWFGSNRSRWVGWTFFFLALVALAWTLQRGAWIAATCQLIAWLWVAARRGRSMRSIVLVAGLVLGASILTVAFPGVRNAVIKRVTSMDDSGRVHYWSSAIDMAEERPALGWGIGSFALAYDTVKANQQPRQKTVFTAHSLPLHVLAERGWIGFAALMLFALAVAIRQPRVDSDHNLTTGFFLAGIGLLVYGFFQYVPYIKTLEWLCWLLLAAWILISRPRESWNHWISWAALCLVATAVIAAPFRDPVPWNSNHSFGLHGWEGSGATGTRLTPGSHRWIAPHTFLDAQTQGDWLSFSMIDGHPNSADYPSAVRVRVNGSLVYDGEVPDRWSRCTFPAGSDRRSALEFEISSGFRPFNSIPSKPHQPVRDARNLGLVLRNDCGSVLCWQPAQEDSETPIPVGCYPAPK